MNEDNCKFCGDKLKAESPSEKVFECLTSWVIETNNTFVWYRSNKCYKTELAALRTELAEKEARLGEAEGLLQDCRDVKTRIDAIHPDGLPAKYADCYWEMKEVFPKIETFLSLTNPAYVPKTEMGAKMMALRKTDVIDRGMTLLSAEEITGEGMVLVWQDDLKKLLQAYWWRYDLRSESKMVEIHNRLEATLEEKP